MDRKELMEMFNRQPRLGTLATSDGKGHVNTAVFSALNMISEEIVVMAIGENRSGSAMRGSGVRNSTVPTFKPSFCRRAALIRNRSRPSGTSCWCCPVSTALLHPESGAGRIPGPPPNS